nr:hypothetical protein [Ardenticatenia bacterium]
MENNTSTDVDKLITFGKMALEQGWYDQARENFEQALALDASNREAMKGLARVYERLSRKEAATVGPIEDEPVGPPAKVERKRSISQKEVKERGKLLVQWFQRQSERGKIIILVSVSFMLCCLCGIFGNVMSPTTSFTTSFDPTPWPTSTRELPVTIEIVAPYRGQEPTSTPITIPTSLPTPSASSDTMLEYINASRAEYDLSVLTLDSTLSHLAQLRADDLADEYTIGHRTPSYGYLDEMLRGTGVNCCQIGENIARTTSLERGHAGLMESPGHKENILKRTF